MVFGKVRREVRVEEGFNMKKNIKKLCGTLAFVLFFILLGLVGALEQGRVPFKLGTIRIVVALCLEVLLTWLAGGFETSLPMKKENRPGVVETPKGDEQNTHLDYTRTIYF